VLRDFFRYGQAKGWNTPSLALSLKAPRTYKNEDVPSFVPWDVVRKILDERKAGGGIAVRDYAVLLLLSAYGMRCSEVTGMKLKDIDWRKEQFFLRRAKGCKPQMMSLLPIVGDAIIRYIREVRYNESKSEYLFVCIRAPHGKLSNAAVYRMVSGALKGHGVHLRHYGPHSLRHGRATQLINTGYSLKEIADILGHMRLDTTTIYAKVDMKTLRAVADMDWEGLL
jgi:site-specific recombinase XerD